MKITKIKYTKKTCENCEKAPAEVDIHIGTKSLMFSLCKNCGIDLYNECGAYMHLLSEKDKCKDCSDKTYACAFTCIKNIN